MAAAKPAVKPWLSGFCNPTNDDASHRRCPVVIPGVPSPCCCLRPGCHNAPATPEEPTLSIVPNTPELTPEVVAAADAALSIARMGDAIRDVGIPNTITGAVDLVVAAAEHLNTIAGEPYPNWVDAVRLLDRLRDATDAIGAVTANLTRHVYLTGEHGEQVIEGLGVVKIARGRDRRSWDGQAVIGAVLEAHLEKRAAEGLHESPAPWDVVEWLLEVLPVDRPRVTPIRALGLDPTEYCTDTPGKIGVQLPSRS